MIDRKLQLIQLFYQRYSILGGENYYA